jgi:hypothetical protein
MFLIENVIRSACRKLLVGPLNILLIAENNEKYMSLVCKTQNNFYLWDTGGVSWKNEIEKRPENLQVINKDWPTSYMDMIICNNRVSQYDLAASLSHRFHLPIVLIDHCSRDSIQPFAALTSPTIDCPNRLSKNPSATISISEYISLSGPSGKLRLVIPTAIDTDKFCIPDGRLPDSAFGPHLTERRIIFDNNTRREVATSIFAAFGESNYSVLPTDSDVGEKERIYKQGDYFINPQNYVTVKMLESMACGNIPICFSKPDLVQFIENGVNGFIINDLSQIKGLLAHLDELTQAERTNISENARAKVISSQLTTEDFITKWTSVFNYMKSQYYDVEDTAGSCRCHLCRERYQNKDGVL